MPSLIRLEDGSVRWDYDLPAEPVVEESAVVVAPKKSAAKKES